MSQDNTSNGVFIGNLPQGFTFPDVVNLCKAYGVARSAKMMRVYCFAYFDTPEEAQRVAQGLHGHSCNGNVLRVEVSRSAPQKKSPAAAGADAQNGNNANAAGSRRRAPRNPGVQPQSQPASSSAAAPGPAAPRPAARRPRNTAAPAADGAQAVNSAAPGAPAAAPTRPPRAPRAKNPDRQGADGAPARRRRGPSPSGDALVPPAAGGAPHAAGNGSAPALSSGAPIRRGGRPPRSQQQRPPAANAATGAASGPLMPMPHTGRQGVALEFDPQAGNIMEPREMWVNGACVGEPHDPNAKAGIGVWYRDGDRRNMSVRISDLPEGKRYHLQTGNRAEITAAIYALRQVNGDGRILPPTRPILIHTDSSYVVKGITVWVYGWIKHDWIRTNGSHVENRDLWEDLLCEVRKSGRRIYFNKVAATGHDAGNEGAHTLARAACQ